uniref:Apple domain-containing protein n=1 Tax=Romanomermis culicivorax TaxID=13658 RepID=A0A915L4A3_ROMCU
MIPNYEILICIFIASLAGYSLSAKCPSAIFFSLVDGWDQRDVFQEKTARTMEDCVRKCYANNYCFSAMFAPGEGSRDEQHGQCRFAFFPGYNCSTRTTTTVHLDPLVLQWNSRGEDQSPKPENR